MCRLVAHAGEAIGLDRLMFGGEHSLLRQSWTPRELLSGSVNADGYGVAWLPDPPLPRERDAGSEARSADRSAGFDARAPVGSADRTGAEPSDHADAGAGDVGAGAPDAPAFVRIARAEPPWYDPELPPLLASVPARIALAALRNATPGIPVDRSGLPPLLHAGWAFVLNGWVPDFRTRHMRALRSTLPDALYAALAGPSDAETLFLLTLALVHAEGASPLEALQEVVRRIAERLGAGETAPLTLVLASARGIAALNAAPGGGPCNSLYVARGTDLAPHGTLLASEPLDGGAAWEPVGAGTWVTIGPGGDVERGVSRAGRPPR